VTHPKGDDYQARFDALTASGADVHGEAAFVASLEPRPSTVLDAGCGTGRVAIELSRRGFEVVGVDVDPAMLATARRLAPALDWREADLAAFDLGRRFDVVVMAGNVVHFVRPATEAEVIARCVAHVAPGGALVAGFQLGAGRCGIDDLDRHARGLALEARYATWDREPWRPGADYAVSVLRAPPA
jgi:SAM-dependent methyltransferase